VPGEWRDTRRLEGSPSAVQSRVVCENKTSTDNCHHGKEVCTPMDNILDYVNYG